MLNQKDAKILQLIEKDCKLSTMEISRKTGIPPTTVHNRIKKMEKEGIIKHYKAVIDKKKIGRGIGAYVEIVVNYPSDSSKDFQEGIAKKLAFLPEVEDLAIMTGETDIMLKVYVRDTDELNDLVTKKLRIIEGIDKTRTAVILKENFR